MISESAHGAGAAKPSDFRTYTIVWALLMLGTGITVAAASFDFGKLAIIVCLGIATVKSVLVFLYFMHLRHEKRMIIKLSMPLAFVALAIFIGLTYVDVLTR